MEELYILLPKVIKNKIVFIKEHLNKALDKKKFTKIIPYKGNNLIEAKDIYEHKNKMLQKIIKKRNSGIDLIRLVAMLGIVYTHILAQGKGTAKYFRYKNEIRTLTFVFWHNNAFTLIAGIVGYKSTKYSNLLYLWMCVVFYSLGIHYYFQRFISNVKVNGELYKEYYPVIYNRYWFFTSYFGMFIFLPAINKGLQYLNKSEFKLLVLSIFFIFVFWFNYINNKIDVFYMNNGFSTIWFLCMYIIGVYIGKFNLVFIGIKRYIICFIFLFMFLFLCFIYNKYRDYTISYNNRDFEIKLINFIKKLMSSNLNSVIKTTQAILITLFFLQLKYNEYLSKLITFFGPLTFGVYLIHLNINVKNYYLPKILIKEPVNLTVSEAIKMIIFKSIKFFLECIIIEYLRHLLFNILRIRKICIYIEKFAFKIVS